jgi:hypothetical protein
MNPKKNLVAGFITMFMALVLAMPVLAQDSTDDADESEEDLTLEEVITTGTRSQRPAQQPIQRCPLTF